MRLTSEQLSKVLHSHFLILALKFSVFDPLFDATAADICDVTTAGAEGI